MTLYKYVFNFKYRQPVLHRIGFAVFSDLFPISILISFSFLLFSSFSYVVHWCRSQLATRHCYTLSYRIVSYRYLVQNVLEHFTVDSNNTRVAVVTFSTSVTVDINDLEPGKDTDAETKCTLYARLDRLVASQTPYGYTATHDALQIATQVSAQHKAFLNSVLCRSIEFKPATGKDAAEARSRCVSRFCLR